MIITGNAEYYSRKPIWVTWLIFFAIVSLINAISTEQEFTDPYKKLEFQISTKDYQNAEVTLCKLLKNDSTNLNLHYQFVNNHFSISETKEKLRVDDSLKSYYSRLAQSSDTIIADIGLYGNGLIQSLSEDYHSALNYFLQVRNKNLPYVNNSIGFAMVNIDSVKQAEKYFLKEIQLKGNIDGAYSNLIRLLEYKGENARLVEMLYDESISGYFPYYLKESIYFTRLDFFNYVKTLFNRSTDVNVYGFLAALLILLSWAIFLLKLDIFEKEKWQYPVLIVIGGMLSTLIVYPLSDLNNYILGFDLNGNILNDFLYCMIGIGAVEELVKIIPVLLLLKFSKQIDEPYDYILYGALSALGFAFAENLIYFREEDLGIIHGRALLSVMVHMFNTSVICYGMAINRFRYNKNKYLMFGLFFLIAAFLHGFFDFWIINQKVSHLGFISIIIVIVQVQIFNILKNNTINQSIYFDEKKSIDNKNLHDYLFISLTGILLFEFIIQSIRWSPGIATDELLASFKAGTWLIVYMSINLSHITLKKGYWAPVKVNIELTERISVDLKVGQLIDLQTLTNNSLTAEYLPNKGTIEKSTVLSDEPCWYLIKLDLPSTSTEYHQDYVFITPKDLSQAVSKTYPNYFAIYLIPLSIDFNDVNLKRTELSFCGWFYLKVQKDAVHHSYNA